MKIKRLPELTGEVAMLWSKKNLFMHDATTTSAILFRIARDAIIENRNKLNEIIEAINDLAGDKKQEPKQTKKLKSDKIKFYKMSPEESEAVILQERQD